MVSERVDEGPRLVDRLGADRSGVPPLQREVLQEQEAQFVGGVVGVAMGDVPVHAQGVEAEIDRRLDVVAGRGGLDAGEIAARRQQVGALEEDPLAVDRTDPVVPRHLTEAGAPLTAVAQFAVDEHFDGDHRERLVADRTRPPQRRVGQVEAPLEVVVATRHHVGGLGARDAVDQRADPDRSLRVAVEPRGDAQVGAARVGVATEHTQAIDAHRPGVVEADGTPQPSRVVRPVEPLRLLEHAGDVAAVADVALRGAGDLDGEDVFVVEPAEIGDVEAVRDEVALRVAEIGTVEPHVALVQHAVERHPSAAPLGWCRSVEVRAVQDRAVARRELRVVLPLPRHVDLAPLRSDRVETDPVAPDVVVGLGGDPRAGKFHRGRA